MRFIFATGPQSRVGWEGSGADKHRPWMVIVLHLSGRCCPAFVLPQAVVGAHEPLPGQAAGGLLYLNLVGHFSQKVPAVACVNNRYTQVTSEV